MAGAGDRVFKVIWQTVLGAFVGALIVAIALALWTVITKGGPGAIDDAASEGFAKAGAKIGLGVTGPLVGLVAAAGPYFAREKRAEQNPELLKVGQGADVAGMVTILILATIMVYSAWNGVL